MATPENRAADGGFARRPVASYASYAEAERAVDYLSDNEFPVERIQIVGRDLRLEEQVTGRVTTARAALNGALTGAFVGLLIGWLFALFDWLDPIVASGWLILDCIWFGTLAGALLGLLQHAMLGGRRDFSSVPAMRAERYEVLVEDDVAERAEELLRRVDEPDRERDNQAAPSRS